jgi:hypothetical protein
MVMGATMVATMVAMPEPTEAATTTDPPIGTDPEDTIETAMIDTIAILETTVITVKVAPSSRVFSD